MALVDNTKEAGRGGFKAIKSIRGLLVNMDEVEGNPDFADEQGRVKNQVKVEMSDVAILAMFPGEDEVELKDGNFTFWLPYSFPGKKPNKNSIWVKVFVQSAEKLGTTPNKMIGQYVTLDKLPVFIFKTPKEGSPGEYNEIWTDNYYSFVEDTAGDASNIAEYIKGLLIGLKPQPASRALATDDRAKQFPEYKDALRDGRISDIVDVVLGEDGKYQDALEES